MQSSRLLTAALGGVFAAGLLGGIQAPAKADTASTEAIVAGAVAIFGALLYDSNNRAYYERDGRNYYVTDDQARYYREHRQYGYAPQPEYSNWRAQQNGYRSQRGGGPQEHANQSRGNGWQNGNDQRGRDHR